MGNPEVSAKTSVALAAIRDDRLTFAARGLYIYLANLPVGQTPSMASCNAPDGRTKLASRLRELKKIGAIRYEVIRGLDGRVAGKTMVIVPPAEWALDPFVQCKEAEVASL